MDDGFEDDVSLSPSSPVMKAEDELEDDKYEESLDLDTSQQAAKVWLVRMPKFLMEEWKDIDFFSGKELGQVRIKQQPTQSPNQNQNWKVKLRLNDTPRTSDLPHEYDLTLVHQTVENTYVFKEQELPKERRSGGSDAADLASERPSSSSGSATQGSNPGKTGDQAADFAEYDRYQPVIKNVPKKTSLVGTVVHECLVTPDFKDPNYHNVVAKRRRMEMPEPEKQVTLLNDTAGVGGVKYGASLKQQKSVWARALARRDQMRSGEGKAIRMPRDELLDRLFSLFEEVEHWTLKALRDRTHQPEAYLKETLDQIAVLAKKGPYAMKYGLRPEFKQLKGQGVSISETVGIKEDGDAKEESSDEEMETII